MSTATTALVRALPPLEFRGDDPDPNLLTLTEEVHENNLGTTTDIDGVLSDADSFLSLVAMNRDDSSSNLIDDLGSPSLFSGDDMIISDSLASSCVGPASKKRDLSDGELLL